MKKKGNRKRKLKADPTLLLLLLFLTLLAVLGVDSGPHTC
jgi:hypothetical protein